VGKGSPVWADGKLYVTEVNGWFHIIEPGAEAPRQLDRDELTVADGRYAEIYGSPAVADGRIYFATEGGLYCLGQKDRQPGKPAERAPARVAPAGQGPAAQLLVVPAEQLARPGETLVLEARGFDASGRPLGPLEAQWSLAGLKGELAGGRFTAPREVPFQAGEVVATSGALTASGRVRIVSDLPWSEDFSAYAAGSVPPHWVGAPGKFEVQEREGNKVLVKPYRERGLLRNALFMGPSTMRNFTIEADVMGAEQGRRHTDASLIANGYTLSLMGNHQRIVIENWPSEERIRVEQPFPWEMNRWYRMKLRVEVDGKRAVVRGKAWPRGEAEPATWTIVAEDPHPVPAGSAGLEGYSPADLLFDNIRVTSND
jgi:hypothetical protein